MDFKLTNVSGGTRFIRPSQDGSTWMIDNGGYTATTVLRHVPSLQRGEFIKWLEDQAVRPDNLPDEILKLVSAWILVNRRQVSYLTKVLDHKAKVADLAYATLYALEPERYEVPRS